jgi:hypothetical protein
MCVVDAQGNESCAATCTDTDSSACIDGTVCSPLPDSSGFPVGPYVCKANDGESYDGCGTAVCNACATTGFSCAKAGNNNAIYYCGQNCKVDTDCEIAGVGQAGVCCLPVTACGECPGFGSCGAGVCGPCM